MDSCDVLLKNLSKSIKSYYSDKEKIPADLWDETYQFALNEAHHETVELFNELSARSVQEIFYWEFCDFELYRKCFDERLEEFKNKHPSARSIDFLHSELKSLESRYQNGYLAWIDEEILEVYDGLFNPPFFLPRYGSDLDFLGLDKVADLRFAEKAKRDFIEDEIMKENQFRKTGIEKKIHSKLTEIESSKFDIADRYYLLRKVVDVDSIPKTFTSKKAQNKIIATILNCHVDTARDLINKSYGPFKNMKDEQIKKLNSVIEEWKSY